MGARRPHTGLTGAAGEYYVAAELSRRGWLATVTIKNAFRRLTTSRLDGTSDDRRAIRAAEDERGVTLCFK